MIKKQPTLKELLEIDSKHKNEELRMKLCLKYNICPECSSKIDKITQRDFVGLKNYYKCSDEHCQFSTQIYV